MSVSACFGDPLYTFTGLGLPQQSNSAVAVNASGEVIGNSSPGNFFSTGWIYSNGTTTTLGLPGSQYASSGVGGLNATGDVVGASSIGDQYFDHADLWFYNGSSTVQIGLTSGGPYSYVSNNMTYRNSEGIGDLTPSGEATGVSFRYSPGGGYWGTDAWLFNGNSTQQIGLSGTVYGYSTRGQTFESSSPVDINDSNEVIGVSRRYSTGGSSLGEDTWLWNGTSTLQIGLTGTNYSYASNETSGPLRLNDAGDVLGYSNRFSVGTTPAGVDTWLYNGTSTQQIGLTGAGYSYVRQNQTYEGSNARTMNSQGQATGVSLRFDSAGDSLGQDAWIFNGSTSLNIGLTGGVYGYQTTVTGQPTYRWSMAQDMNNKGEAIGQTNRYSSSGAQTGQDAWLYNGSSTQQIGLTGPGFNAESNAIAINDAGDVIGQTVRSEGSGSGLNEAGWFFDAATESTIPLQFSLSSGGISDTTPEIVTPNGVVLGTYELYNGATDLGSHAFIWSKTGGFYDLGSIVEDSANAPPMTDVNHGSWSTGDWPDYYSAFPNALGTTPDGWPSYILANGATLLSAVVPEPTNISIVAMAVLGLLVMGKRFARAAGR